MRSCAADVNCRTWPCDQGKRRHRQDHVFSGKARQVNSANDSPQKRWPGCTAFGERICDFVEFDPACAIKFFTANPQRRPMVGRLRSQQYAPLLDIEIRWGRTAKPKE